MSALSSMGKYNGLFPDDKTKAEAFDKIAERFYRKNFGTMSKTDMETLMFSIYIEQILKKGDKKFSAYSDYTLAKQLGISQTKVSNLKVRKQLQYPRDYDWRESFKEISDRARYENGKISIQIPDINLYYDIKNDIEEKGGFVEVTLNRTLLVIPLNYFLDFMAEVVADEKDRDKIRKEVQAEFRKHKIDQEIAEREPIGKYLKKIGTDTAIEIIGNVVKAFAGPTTLGVECAVTIGKNIFKAIEDR